MALVDHKGFRRGVPAAILLIAAAAAYGAVAYLALLHAPMTAEEAASLVRSWWYTTGAVTPYTATDATWSMPLFFYQLGWWQHLGLGQVWGRAMSVGIGVANGVLLFAICQRLTANALAAAGAVFIFLATPATSFIFSGATPAATVSLVHLAAIWLLVTSLGRPRPWATVIFGLLMVALYFYRQNMILAVVALVPLYIAGIGKKRGLHSAVLIGVMAVTTAGLLYAFPHKLAEYAARLPVIYGWLQNTALLPPHFVLIERGSTSAITANLALDRFSAHALYDFFLLPYAGTLIVALALLAVVSGPLRILWVATFYFVWLAVTHIVGSLGFCGGSCMLNYTPYFVGVGAIAAGLTLAMAARWARQRGGSPGFVVIGVSVIVVAINTFAPGVAFNPTYKFFPVAALADPRAPNEAAQTETLARWIASNSTQREPILLIHGLGTQRVAELPYATFLAGHVLPPQSFDLARTRRMIGTRLTAAQKEAVQGAIEEESLWSDETMKRWIAREYDLIVFQDDKTPASAALLTDITAQFDRAATTTFRGATLILFKRKSAQ